MIVMKMPRLYSIVGADNVSGFITSKNVTCEYVCPRGWLTSSMSYVDFYSYGPSKVTYWIEVDYDIRASPERVLIPIYVLGGLVGLIGIIIIIFCLYRRYKIRRIYQQF